MTIEQMDAGRKAAKGRNTALRRFLALINEPARADTASAPADPGTPAAPLTSAAPQAPLRQGKTSSASSSAADA